MKFFDRWLHRKMKFLWEHGHELEPTEVDYSRNIKMNTAVGAKMSRLNEIDADDRINFNLTPAVGGRILQVSRYDRRNDQHENTTYVIPTGEDVGERVAKILNLELLK